MPVYFAAAAMLAIYFLAIPVRFALSVRIAERSGFGAGLSLFDGRRALRRADRRARGKKKSKAKRRRKQRPDLKSMLKLFEHLLRHGHLDMIQVRGVICTGDAASTALICGGAYALAAALPPGLIRMDLSPDFSPGRSDIALRGMVSLRAGHIILAALIGARHYFARSRSHGKTSD